MVSNIPTSLCHSSALRIDAFTITITDPPTTYTPALLVRHGCQGDGFVKTIASQGEGLVFSNMVSLRCEENVPVGGQQTDANWVQK